VERGKGSRPRWQKGWEVVAENEDLDELTQTCTTIIWVASALHAAVNFGQYPYAGYHPNRPTISRRFMPEPGTLEFDQLIANPERAFLRTITNQVQALVGISLIELLSRHSSDEVYLGQRDTPEWTSDAVPLEAFERFQMRLKQVEANILRRNDDETLKNRVGPAKLPYTLLYPSSGIGITGRGIPNSISTWNWSTWVRFVWTYMILFTLLQINSLDRREKSLIGQCITIDWDEHIEYVLCRSKVLRFYATRIQNLLLMIFIPTLTKYIWLAKNVHVIWYLQLNYVQNCQASAQKWSLNVFFFTSVKGPNQT